LVIVAKADFLGRTTEESQQGIYHAGEWLLEKASKLNVKDKATPPLLQGRDLIALDMNPSPKFGQILNEIYERQLDGEIGSREEALEWVRDKYKTSKNSQSSVESKS
jgi:tRNA nucleotidyltransferase/poly(A) polymerase